MFADSAAVWLQGNASSSWHAASVLPATARSKQPDRVNPGYRFWHCHPACWRRCRPVGRFDIVKLFVTYLLQTQDEAHLPRLSEEWRRRAPEAGGDFVTIAEMLIKQGRQEGRLETLEQLVRSGAEWPLIESAAGNDPGTLRALRERMDPEQTNGHGDGADQPQPPR